MIRNPAPVIDSLSAKVTTLASGPGVANNETVNLQPGMPICTLSGGAYRCLSGNYGRSRPIGLVSLATAPTLQTPIVSDGWLSLSAAQWDAVTGDSGGLVPGADYFVGASAGSLTTTPPISSGSVVASVGRAVDNLTMRVQLGDPVLL